MSRPVISPRCNPPTAAQVAASARKHTEDSRKGGIYIIPSLYPTTLASHGPMRSLQDYLNELCEQYSALPMQDRRRGLLADRIRQVEAQIDVRAAGAETGETP